MAQTLNEEHTNVRHLPMVVCAAQGTEIAHQVCVCARFYGLSVLMKLCVCVRLSKVAQENLVGLLLCVSEIFL